MNNINKTLYIPLYGKATISKKNIILHDPKAEGIWAEVKCPLGRRSRSKWLMYYMAMRARVFDDWCHLHLEQIDSDSVVLHLGAGLDSRALRIGEKAKAWYDIDFPEVIEERRHYYEETERYHMIASNVLDTAWLDKIIPCSKVIILMEGISMYLTLDEINTLLSSIEAHFDSVSLLMDVYTAFGVKMSKYKNPTKEVGVEKVYGIDHPNQPISNTSFKYIAEHSMTPRYLVDELKGMDRCIFKTFFTGALAHKAYRLYEYRYTR